VHRSLLSSGAGGRRLVLVPQTQDYAPSLANDPKHAHETFQHITPTLMEIAKGSGEQLPARERAHFAHMRVGYSMTVACVRPGDLQQLP
jgi:hypothetical protein